jgi:hypothetical protein
MSKFFTKIKLQVNKSQKGYALLFTIIIVSAISIITAGLSNTAYKQLILSSLAKDSQAAFYQSDTASDCALYADRVEAVKTPTNIFTTGFWSCGGSNLVVSNISANGYTISPESPEDTSLNPCFRIDVIKDHTTPNILKTKIKAKGYNICNKNNSRTVEREIEINYQEEL